MKALQVFATSQGKGNRNDDFYAHFQILSTRVLAILGDFTSDSPKGANTRLQQSLEAFVAKRIVTWREHLIPPQDILGLVGRFINRELQQNHRGAKTTLCACVVDSHERQLHFLNVGDSGLGTCDDGAFQFLRKGDTAGARDATGFLPLETEAFAVYQAECPIDSLVLLFTDGFWENSAHFLDTGHAEPFLASLMAQPTLAEVASQFREQILARSNQRDDLTLMIVKEETVAQKSNGPNQPVADQWEAMVEKKVFEILDRQDSLRPIPPSPMETEFLRVLKQTATGLQAMERRILESLRQGSETQFQEMMEHWRTEMGQFTQTLQQLQDDVKEQRLTFKARVVNAVSDATRDLRQLRNLADLPEKLEETQHRLAIMETTQRQANIAQLKGVNLAQMQRRLGKLEKQSQNPPSMVSANRTPEASLEIPTKEPTENADLLKRMLWPLLNSAVLLLLLGWMFFFARGPGDVSKEGPAESGETQPRESASVEKQQPSFSQLAGMSTAANPDQSPTWPQNIPNLEPPDEFLRLLGLSQSRFRREFSGLARAIAKARGAIQEAEQAQGVIESVPVVLENVRIAGRSQFNLHVRSNQSAQGATTLTPWLKQYTTGANLYPSNANLRDIWLQIHANVATIDGAFGPASMGALKARLEKNIQLGKAAELLAALENWQNGTGGDAGGDAVLNAAAAFLPSVSPSQWQADLVQFKKALAEGQPRRSGETIFESVMVAGNVPRHAVLGANGQLTPLGRWFLAQAETSGAGDGPLLWELLAARLGVEDSGGKPDPVRAALQRLEGQTLDGLLGQIDIARWEKP